MTELDGNLSEWVGVARNAGPVTVDRYETPWVCIVAYPTWLEINYLKFYVPSRDHALVTLSNALDHSLSYESIFTHELSQRCESGVDARVVIRAWVLQIVYSIACAAQVREALGYNMLWRWFIGYTHTADPLPDTDRFIEDMRMVSAEPRIVELVYRCLADNIKGHADTCEFSVNFGLLHTLRDHHKLVANDPSTDPLVDDAGDQQLHG
ncbi:MAG: transposase [Rhodocyclaceae bacterium]